MYLNYYENEVNDEGDNKPIGIILCTDKDSLTAEYALGGLSSNSTKKKRARRCSCRILRNSKGNSRSLMLKIKKKS